MPSLSIRKLDEETYNRLRKRAAENGRSMEAEARAVIEKVVNAEPFDRKAFASELQRRAREISSGRLLQDSSPGIREDRESR